MTYVYFALTETRWLPQRSSNLFLLLLVFSQGLQVTAENRDIDSLTRLSGRMECESPNRHLYDFVGNMRLEGHRFETLAFTLLPGLTSRFIWSQGGKPPSASLKLHLGLMLIVVFLNRLWGES